MILHNDILSSRNNPTIKWAASLKDKKGRESSGAFIVEGEKLTYEAISCGLEITHIFILEGKNEAVIQKLSEYQKEGKLKQCEVFVVKPTVFEKISTEIAPQGVISVVKHLDFFRRLDIIYKEEFLKKPAERAIILCSVRDPGNMGAVIRSSVAFGVGHIIVSDDCADVYNPKTLRGAMGSLFRVKVTRVSDLSETVNQIKLVGRRVFAAELTEKAMSVADANIRKDDIIIIGNEGHGIPGELSSLCNGSVYIPISTATESLNASVAAAVFMWEQSKLEG